MEKKRPMKIQIENRQSRFKIEKRKIRSTVSTIFQLLDCPDKEVSIVLTDDKHIQALNKTYLGRDKTTNVISFSLQEGEHGNINPQLLGDVVISLDTAQKDALKGNLALEQEIEYLLIHGILHLLGYNHENTSQAETRKMKQKEKEIFSKLNRNQVLI
ncbi:MAG: rRNA maturation RNase YbeY [Smithella sp.]|nr:rRNA maturation RNase YbeY [Smithella sp.]